MSSLTKTVSYTTNSSFLRRVQSGNENAWREFYQKYSGMICHIGKKRNLSPEECEDLMIEVMMIFWKKMDSFVYDSQRGKFRSYLGKFADFCALRRFASSRRHNAALASISVEYPPDIDSACLEEWQKFLLDRALEELKESVDTVTFQVFYMSFFQQRPVAEISVITRKTANNIYMIRFRCLAKLRKLIKEYRQFSERELLRNSHKKADEY